MRAKLIFVLPLILVGEVKVGFASSQCLELFNIYPNTQPFSVYSADDFPTSQMWVGKENDRYPIWATNVANTAIALFDQGVSPRDVLEFVRTARMRFQDEIGNRGTEEHVGEWRFNTPGDYSSYIGHTYLSEVKRAKDDRTQLARLALFTHPSLTRLGSPTRVTKQGTEYRFVRLQYTLLNEKQIGAQMLANVFENRYLSVIHPAGRNAELIYHDVMERIENLSRFPRRSQFFSIMYGYYASTPFLRGSAAIGRIFFSALYYSLFREKLNSPQDIDVLALILPKDQFVAKMLDHIQLH